jgi:hypothetical protein
VRAPGSGPTLKASPIPSESEWQFLYIAGCVIQFAKKCKNVDFVSNVFLQFIGEKVGKLPKIVIVTLATPLLLFRHQLNSGNFTYGVVRKLLVPLFP